MSFTINGNNVDVICTCRCNKITEKKKPDLNAQAMTFGSFGTGTWNVITTACKPDRHPRAGVGNLAHSCHAEAELF